MRSAYEGKGWDVSSVESTAEQCKREAKDPAAAAKTGEDCNMKAVLL